MNLLPTAEQREIGEATADFMRGRLPLTRFHAFPYDQPELPGSMPAEAARLGLFGHALDESQGGSGGTLPDEMLVFREIGREAGPLWLLGGVMGARVAAESGANGVRDGILGGQAPVCVAHRDPVSGGLLLFGAAGSRYAVTVDAAGGKLFDCDKLKLRAMPCIERQMSLAEAGFDKAAIVASADHLDLAHRYFLLLASMQTGIAEAARDMAVAYAKVREQFGRPIGSFQAIAHLCADMAVRCEEAHAQMVYAALCLNDGLPEGAFELHAAAALAIRAAVENARMGIQVHGAIAMNEVHDAHYFVKRAHVLETLLGGTAFQLEAMMQAAA